MRHSNDRKSLFGHGREKVKKCPEWLPRGRLRGVPATTIAAIQPGFRVSAQIVSDNDLLCQLGIGLWTDRGEFAPWRTAKPVKSAKFDQEKTLPLLADLFS